MVGQNRHDGEHPWRACLVSPDGAVLGAGVLVDRWHVLTCAHVVAEALGAGPETVLPSGEVSVELPFLPASLDDGTRSVSRIPARVTRRGWVPPSDQGNGDLTLLRLSWAAPAGSSVARLTRTAKAGSDGVLVFGHPADAVEGVWARTRVTGVCGPGGEWMQLDAVAATGRAVTHGFSGAGAVDQVTGEVLGVVVAADRDTASRVAWVIRMETAVTYLPELAALLDGASPRRTPENPSGAEVPPARSAALPRLRDTEREEFFDRLLAVPGMSDRTTRDTYVRWLAEKSYAGFPPIRHDDDRMDVWELTRALASHPQALRGLIADLRTIHQGSPEVTSLEQFTERTFPDLLLDHAERVALEHLLDGVAPSWAAVALRSATAGLAIPPVTGRTTVPEAVRELEGYGWVRGGPLPPLFVFVDDLAHLIGGPGYVNLHHWIDAVGERLDIPREQLQTLCDAASRRRAEQLSLSLVIQLDDDLSDPDHYLMSALLMQHDRTERVLHRDDVGRTLPEIVAQLDTVLRMVPEGLGEQMQDPVIEFLLPRRLMAEPVDEWDAGGSAFHLPLGLRYPVVIRSLDRMRDLTYRVNWRRKSRRLIETGRLLDPEALHLEVPRASPDVPDPVMALFATLTNQEKVVCLAIPRPPDASLPQRSDVFAAGLAAGLPIVIWARDAEDQHAFFDVVRRLLDRGPLEVPQQVLRHRRDVASGSAPGDGGAVRVGVLFDDADRVPARFRHPVRLQAPH
ncbi:MAG: Trypsin-like peptidase [Actinomycetota bacterium]|nr:Trypsin-like peptidase [Actinomycetota bacterium]